MAELSDRPPLSRCAAGGPPCASANEDTIHRHTHIQVKYKRKKWPMRTKVVAALTSMPNDEAVSAGGLATALSKNNGRKFDIALLQDMIK